MGYTIDIDTGGTFTDCFLHKDGQLRTVKVTTTPHDLTVCFLEAIKAGAAAFGVSTGDMLYETDIIRFSNTIGTNTIIQRDGSKIGLLVTAGQEHLAPTVDVEGRSSLVAADMVAGVGEQTSEAGVALSMPEPDVVLAAAQDLIDRGARALVVAFANSECNPANERRVRDIIKNEYPRDYLGSVPVFLASDISTRSGPRERINAAVLNGYIHAKLARLLYQAGEDLRRNHYQNNLFISHNNGGVARVAKTRAINTYNSGPAAGLLGAQKIAQLYGVNDLITTDMGGTSFDIGYVTGGQPALTLEPDIEGFKCNLPMVRISAFGAAGGSIARVSAGEIKVGPQSAGAVPGPACFNLGGTEPTLTDANLVLGILDPDYFLGGGMRLDYDKAQAVISEKIARPLDITAEQAACFIRARVEESMGREVAGIKAKFPPRTDPLLIAYGGAGALHACAIAAVAGIRRIVITPFSAVASAFSSSLMDAGHQYYRRLNSTLENTETQSQLLDAVASMQREAQRDMRGEGFSAVERTTEIQIFLCHPAGGGEVILRMTPEAIDRPDTMQAIAAQAGSQPGIKHGNKGNFVLTTAGLFTSTPISHYQIAQQARTRRNIDHAGKGTRPVCLVPERGYEDIRIYARERLEYGHDLTGPALIEAEQTTILVPDGWRLEIDEYNHARLEPV